MCGRAATARREAVRKQKKRLGSMHWGVNEESAIVEVDGDGGNQLTGRLPRRSSLTLGIRDGPVDWPWRDLVGSMPGTRDQTPDATEGDKTVTQTHSSTSPSAAARGNYVVVFADIAGSTRLYETLGDDKAKRIVLTIENKIADIVREMGGLVQEMVGDEVMFRFEDVDRAVACACEIQRVMQCFGDTDSRLALRIGLHLGPAIVEQGRMFGDTVNTAARMAGIAQANQIITTAEVVNALKEAPNAMLRRFDEVKVKGKRDALVVYEVLWHQTNVTAISYATKRSAAPLPLLTLEYQGRSWQLRPWQGIFSIGRSTTSDLVVRAESASRQHGSVEFARGRFVFSDSSTNGTYVQTADGPCLFFRREATPLVGRGEIGFGAPPQTGTDHVIRFVCE
jgi:class 3 adenylate cyclase